MKKWFKRSLIGKFLLLAGFLYLFFTFILTTASEVPDVQLDEETRQCLACHGSDRYEAVDTATGEKIMLRMYKEARIDLPTYQDGTHGQFKCTDCHSTDFEITPHPFSARAEANYTCLDCHGDDEEYASFHFETIEEEFKKSIHATDEDSDVNCWNCHNPHSYKLSSKEPENLTNRITVNNMVCLDCHGEVNYSFLIGKDAPDLIKSHDWLPNQTLHFSRVRCIDCHAATNDSILVAHMVLPAEDAVKKCVECHSTNSILMGSLYKHQSKTARNKYGFFNGVIANESYLVGANRNYYLNIASLSIFIMVLIGIAIHATLRFIFKHKKQGK
ncbi:MAG: cytochrome c3 family protein [Lentimicrobium sp.]|jgi:predicted CXXCH cytochrome family protein|nr:cytochrome c3 family protein [Lentimicrobium sp.]